MSVDYKQKKMKHHYKSFNVRGITNLQPYRLKEFKERGLTIKQMAERCEVSVTTISSRMKEWGLAKKYKKYEKKENPP